jgi:hypothetical protein
MTDSRDLALGIAVTGMRGGIAAGRVALAPARLALRAPLVGPPLRRRADALALDGRITRTRALAEIESTMAVVLASPEVERVAARVLATADLDRLVTVVLDHARTEQVIASALATPGLERLVIRILESRLIDEVTERVLVSPELERIVEYVAASPQVLDAVHQQTRSFADEMAAGVRRKAESADDAAERRIRGWLRRPRPQAT